MISLHHEYKHFVTTINITYKDQDLSPDDLQSFLMNEDKHDDEEEEKAFMSKTKGKGKWHPNTNRLPRKESRTCYICNKQGHLAKDCWQNKNANKREGGPSQNRWRRQHKIMLHKDKVNHCLWQQKMRNMMGNGF